MSLANVYKFASRSNRRPSRFSPRTLSNLVDDNYSYTLVYSVRFGSYDTGCLSYILLPIFQAGALLHSIKSRGSGALTITYWHLSQYSIRRRVSDY